MLMRRARAYSSSCLQVILVCLYPFHRNSLLCNKNRQKITKKFLFSRFKVNQVINIDNPKKLVASACYVKQHVCAYLQPFSL